MTFMIYVKTVQNIRRSVILSVTNCSSPRPHPALLFLQYCAELKIIFKKKPPILCAPIWAIFFLYLSTPINTAKFGSVKYFSTRFECFPWTILRTLYSPGANSRNTVSRVFSRRTVDAFYLSTIKNVLVFIVKRSKVYMGRIAHESE